MFGDNDTPRSFICWINFSGAGNRFVFQVKTYRLGVSLCSERVYPEDKWKLEIGTDYLLHFLINSKMASSHFYSSSA